MKKYPSIEQFRNVVKAVKTSHDFQGKDEEGNAIYAHTEPYPTLTFRGTVKLHGTNASIVKYADGFTYQSRERVLSLDDDNAGFMSKMLETDLDVLFNRLPFTEYAAIYGEWCGKTIQKGTAVNALEKLFVIFGVRVDDVWLELPEDLHYNEARIYNILQFPTFSIDIDFNAPEQAQSKLTELTLAVEACCPVGKFFNIEGVGEGIVFTCVSRPDLKFKSKGEKHSHTRVKVINAADVEMMENIDEFIEAVVTENRLNQGITYLNEQSIPVDAKSTGEFLRWVVMDVMKEENDTMEANGLDEKLVKKAIAAKARSWFMRQV